MRLTIIVPDSVVLIDGVAYSNLDLSFLPPDIHAVQWNDGSGWIEFKDSADGKPENQNIESISDFQQAIDVWNAADEKNRNPPPPSPPTPEQNKAQASYLLSATDYTQLADVLLLNKNEFDAYREQLRAIATNPPEGSIIWPIKPKAVWA